MYLQVEWKTTASVGGMNDKQHVITHASQRHSTVLQLMVHTLIYIINITSFVWSTNKTESPLTFSGIL
jgi:hypothetical protein